MNTFQPVYPVATKVKGERVIKYTALRGHPAHTLEGAIKAHRRHQTDANGRYNPAKRRVWAIRARLADGTELFGTPDQIRAAMA